MEFIDMSVPGAWQVRTRAFPDQRGMFMEWFREDALKAATGRTFHVAQTNLSVSRAGVVRGIHFADVPPGQAKFVTCVQGAVLDVVVDLRVGSPTFGHWDSLVLDTAERNAVFLSEGLGHGFVALEDNSTVTYLCSTSYAPEREHGVDPLDPALGIEWPTVGSDGAPLELTLSAKDRGAGSVAQAEARGNLPTWDDCVAAGVAR